MFVSKILQMLCAGQSSCIDEKNTSTFCRFAIERTFNYSSGLGGLHLEAKITGRGIFREALTTNSVCKFMGISPQFR